MKWLLLVFLISPSEEYISSVALPFETEEQCNNMLSNLDEHNMDGHFQDAICVTREHFEGGEVMDGVELD